MEEEKKLEDDIKGIENDINNNFQNIDVEKLESLSQKKSRLIEIRKQKIEGVMLRSRCRYQDLGEKPSKYFLNLENRQYTNKVMNKITEEDGEEFTSSSDILNCQKRFYEKLYDTTNIIDERTINSISGENYNKLSNVDAEKLEGEILYSELTQALKNMKNDKSPGLDGFTVEFFKFFWSDLGLFVLRSLNYGYRNGNLSVTQRQGIITCLPKPGKNRHFLKNWRPISLLNVIYKLASSVIAGRIKSVLKNLIHDDQKGLISGRFIGENIKLIYDILFETKQQEIPGLILSIDFEKAFDTVSWKFIEKVLNYFNFGPSLISWLRLFQKGSESCIIQNGFMSEFFNLKRGCRQGDPISPYIFILCAEILGQMIRKDKTIKGIKINGEEFKLSQYADDTQLFLDGNEDSLKQSLVMLNTYYKMSGLKINVEKTRAIWIGSLSNSMRQICKNYNLDWSQGPFKILGVIFTTEVFDIWDVNINDTFTRVENVLKQWSKRKLTLLGRITIIKSLALAKFIHLLLALPNPPGDFIKRLERLFFKFLWNAGPDRIKREVIVKDLKAGGLRMININSFIKALKITWLRRVIISSENISWNKLSNIDFQKLFSLGQGYVNEIKQLIDNPFWRELLQNWADLCNRVKVETVQHVLDSPLWYNQKLNNGGNYYIKEWWKKGVRQISDILDEQGEFYQFEDFKEKFDVKGTFLHYQSLLRRIPTEWKNILNTNRIVSIINRFNVKSNFYMQQIFKDKKGCRRIHDIIVGANEFLPHSKWEREIGVITEQQWMNYNNLLASIKEIKLKDFQYKIMNKFWLQNHFYIE